MTDTAPAAPTQTVVVAQPNATRWLPTIVSGLTMIGTLVTLVTALLTIGAWRGQVDASLAQLGRRMDAAEANQKTYIPVLIGLSKDVTFLAERARREDERRDRSAH